MWAVRLLVKIQPLAESTGTITKSLAEGLIRNCYSSTTNISGASIPSQLVQYIMKTHEWTPKKRSRVLGLIQGGRHSLSEISQITNIPKGTIGNLKKRDTPLNKV